MVIKVIDTFKPDGVAFGTLPSPFPTVEDIDVLGGFQIQPNNNYRTNPSYAIPLSNQKVGMLVFEPNTPAYYNLTVLGTMGSPIGTWALAANLSNAVTWIDVTAGTTLTPSAMQQYLSCDSSSSQTIINLPAAASCANGQLQAIKATGSMLSPIIINAGSGSTVELIHSAPGTFGATTRLAIQGQTLFLKYDTATTSWKIVSSFMGSGAPGTPVYNPAWFTATDIYLDPANSAGTSKDSNAGTSQATALLTYAEIERRYGGSIVRITQPTTIHLMSSQTLNVDPIFFNGEGASTGAFSAQMILDGTLGRTVIATTVLGAVTAKVRANPGNDLQVAGMPGGAAAHQLIVNTTRSSAAFIVSVASGVATMSQPIPLATLTTPGVPAWSEDNTWTVGDSITIYTLPLVNLKQWELRGADTASGNNGCAAAVFFCQIADPTGTAGTVFPVQAGAVAINYGACYITVRPHAAQFAGRAGGIFFTGCDIAGQYSVFTGTVVAYGGILRAGCAMYSAMSLGVNSNLGMLSGDIIIIGAAQFSNWIQLGFIHLETSLNVLSGAWQTASTQVWGAGTVTVWPGSTWYNGTGNTFATSLTTGALAFLGGSVGTAIVGGQAINGITLTAANLDTYGTLRDLRGGAAFTNAVTDTGVPLSVPGTPAYNPSWYTLANTGFYWDPANSTGTASDSNTGASSATALLTWGEAIRRFGSDSPTIAPGSNVIVNKLSAQTLNVDPVFFFPRLSKGGYAALIDTLVVFSAAAAGGVVTPLSQSGGTDMTIATIPAGVTAGMYVFNSTQDGYAYVTSVSGTTATVQQPLNASLVTTIGLPTFALGTNWATGDTLTWYNIPNLTNLKAWRPTGGDVVGSAASVGWVQWTQIADASGAGTAEFGVVCDCASSVLTGCYVAPRLQAAGLDGRGQGIVILGCFCATNVGVSAANDFGEVYASYIGGTLQVLGSQANINGNSTVLGTTTVFGGLLIGSGGCHFVGGITIESQSWIQANGNVWGAATLTINPAGTYYNTTGTTFALSLLISGALKFGTATTGTFFTPGTGLWATPTNITQANIDTNNGLQNAQTGARFCNAA
jgi:hypothetical protein